MFLVMYAVRPLGLYSFMASCIYAVMPLCMVAVSLRAQVIALQYNSAVPSIGADLAASAT